MFPEVYTDEDRDALNRQCRAEWRKAALMQVLAALAMLLTLGLIEPIGELARFMGRWW